MLNKVQKTTTEHNLLTLKACDLVKILEINDITFIHDKFDKIIPIKGSKSVSNSNFIEIEGTGHFKMLWTKKVITIIKELLAK